MITSFNHKNYKDPIFAKRCLGYSTVMNKTSELVSMTKGVAIIHSVFN